MNKKYLKYINDGVLINKEICEIIKDTKTQKNILTFPDFLNTNMKKFAKKLFMLNTQIQEVTIPEMVEEIGEKCFYSCNKLEKVKMYNNVKQLGKACFSSCSKLKEVRLSESLTSIPEYCFCGCSNIEKITIPTSVTSLKSYCFAMCTKLKQIILPPTIQEIEDSVFANCSSLEQIDLNQNIKSINERLFQNCSKLKQIKLPSNLTHIGKMSFICCEQLENVPFPKTLTYIGDRAFKNCLGLKNIKIPSSVEKIDVFAFEDCSNLESVEIFPSKNSEIGYGAFFGCWDIQNLNVPQGSLNNRIFNFPNMSKLKHIVYNNREILNLKNDETFENLLNNGKYIYLEYNDSENNTIFKIVEDKIKENKTNNDNSEILTENFNQILNHSIISKLYSNKDEKIKICLNMMSILDMDTCIKFLDKLAQKEEAEKQEKESNAQKMQKKQTIFTKFFDVINKYLFKKSKTLNPIKSFSKINSKEIIDTIFEKPEIKNNVPEFTKFFDSNLDEILNITEIDKLKNFSNIQRNFQYFMLYDPFLKQKCTLGIFHLKDALGYEEQLKYKPIYINDKNFVPTAQQNAKNAEAAEDLEYDYDEIDF